MLHWSQEASTGWTRNSWGCSMAKRACLSLMTGLGRERRIGTGPTHGIYHPSPARCTMRPADARGAGPSTDLKRASRLGPTLLGLTRPTLAATLAGVGVPA